MCAFHCQIDVNAIWDFGEHANAENATEARYDLGDRRVLGSRDGPAGEADWPIGPHCPIGRGVSNNDEQCLTSTHTI